MFKRHHFHTHEIYKQEHITFIKSFTSYQSTTKENTSSHVFVIGKTTRTRVSNYPKATQKFIRDKLFRRRNCEKEFLQDDSKHKPKHQ